MKAGKEEIAGLVAAVDRFVHLDHAELRREWDNTLELWRGALEPRDDLQVSREERNEAGQPIPRLYVTLQNGEAAGALLAAMSGTEPRVAVLPDVRNGVPHGFWISPDLLEPGENKIVLDKVLEAAERIRKEFK